ncbi:MAG: sulfur carrier protein ThiS [Tannerellaceae bacterium]|nr:sulfur carrier protein ThiS [Tannerellaceae bacterium]
METKKALKSSLQGTEEVNYLMATITVNGKNQEVKLPLSVLELIRQNNVKQPEMVSVQVNDSFVNREDFPVRQVKEGDQIEFLYFMGGGSVR